MSSTKKVLRVYVDEDTKKDIKKAADKAQLSESSWARLAILEKLKKH